MADVNIDKFRVSTVRPNTQPANSGNVTTEPQVPVNPPGSGGTTFGGAGAGLSIDGVGKIQFTKVESDGIFYVDLNEFPSSNPANNNFGLFTNWDNYWSSLGDYSGLEILGGTSVLLSRTGDYASGASSSSGTNTSSGTIEAYHFLNPNYARVLVNNTDIGSRIDISKARGANEQSIFFREDNDAIIITDNINSKGLENSGDYEANFIARSLVTKQYVDSAISGAGHNPVTIGSPANGLSISGTQVLTIGLASAGVTGALSGTDWNTFNGKIELTSPITGYTVGANTALADTDTILQAFEKVQGQINARISGTIASGQVAFGTGVNTVGGDAGLTWDNVNKRFGVNRTPTGIFDVNLLLNTDLFSVYNSTTRRFSVRGDGVVRWGNNIDSGNSRGLLSWDTDLAIVAGELNLTLRTAGSNRIYLTNTANVGVNTTSPTNTLDVNGTARIRTISNLGTAATSVLVPSATGVVSLRTLAEFASDGGFTTGSGSNGRVTFWTGANSQSSDSVFLWDNSVKRLNLTKTASSVNDYHLTLNQVAIGNTLNASGLNYLIIDAVTASTGIALVARPKGTPTGFSYNFQFSKTDASTGNSLLFIGGGSAATGNSANKHVISTSASGLATGQRLVLRSANTGVSWETVNDHFTIFPNGRIAIQNSSLEATDNGVQFDVNGTTRFNGNSIFGTLTSTGTASPQNISLGGSFGTNAIGNVGNTKLFLYQDSTPANSYGFGLSSALMEIRSGSGAAIGFFTDNGVESYRILSNQDLQFVNGADFVFGTTTGTQIGTATNQRLAFYGSTPIVKPSGDILTALSNLGLVASPTISGSTVTDAILYTSQTKTATERNQARVNIGSTSSTPQVIATAGAINDFATTSNHLVFTGASVVLSGIVAGLDGEEFTILNASGTNLELLSQSALSVAENRFASGVVVPNLSTVRIKYRTTTARWVLENVGINDGRYLRKDIADTKTGNLTFTNAAIINGHIDVNGSSSASPGVALNRFRNAVAGSGITQFFGTNGGSGRQHFAFYGSGDVEYLSLGNGWISSGVPTLRAVNAVLLQGNASASVRSVNNTFLVRRDELYLNYSQTVATPGTINDLAINADCKLLILTGATDLTGVVPVDNTRLLRIEARSASRIIRNESASSTASNRFSIGADLTINAGEVYQFIYTDSRWRRVL